jgi:acetylornithine deacetylase/succinyl-diaminopimelate desuccinylase-like protein
MLELTEELVRLRGTSYYELDVATYIDWLAEQVGLPSELVCYNPRDYVPDGDDLPDRTANVYITLGKGPDTLVINVPMDVAPGLNAQYDPVELHRDAIYLQGRGVASAMAGIGGALWAAYQMRLAIESHQCRVIIAFTADGLRTGTGVRHHIKWMQNRGYDNGNLSVVVAGTTGEFKVAYTGGRGQAALRVRAPLHRMIPALRRLLAQREDWLQMYDYDDDSQSDVFAPSSVMLSTISCEGEQPAAASLSVHSTVRHPSQAFEGHTALEQAVLESDAVSEGMRYIASDANCTGLIPDMCHVWHGETGDTDLMCTATLDIRTTPAADGDHNGLVRQVMDFFTQEEITATVQHRTRAYLKPSDETSHVHHVCSSAAAGKYSTLDAGVSDYCVNGAYYAALTDDLVSEFGGQPTASIYGPDECVRLDDLAIVPEKYRKLIQVYLSDIDWCEAADCEGWIVNFR